MSRLARICKSAPSPACGCDFLQDINSADGLHEMGMDRSICPRSRIWRVYRIKESSQIRGGIDRSEWTYAVVLTVVEKSCLQ